MDRYDERIIKGKPGASAYLLCMLAVLTAAAGAALLMLIPQIGLIIFLLGIVLIVNTKDLLFVEYEYIITNGDIEIARIVAKKRRKTIWEINGESVTKVDLADSEKTKNDISLGQVKVRRFLGKEVTGTEVAVYSGDGKFARIDILDLDEKCMDHMKSIYKMKYIIK